MNLVRSKVIDRLAKHPANERVSRAADDICDLLAACKQALAALQSESQLDRANAIGALTKAIAQATS